MKKIIFTVVFVLVGTFLYSQTDPILLTIGNKKITKSDFEYLYLKNKYSVKTKPQSVEEYLTLYKKFKLKVLEAESLGYDTLGSFKREYYDYRNQLAVSYLVDKTIEDSLLDEAYKNLLQDVEISHILLRLPLDATPSDTSKVYKKAINAIKRLQKESFDKVALSVSEDVAVKENRGKIGWVTGQMFPYVMEKAMFSLPIGKVSKPIKTNYGYHIIKVTNKRPAVGKVQVAHILKSFPNNATDAQKLAVKNETYKIYDSLKKGEDFAQLALDHSDDKASAGVGGVMKPFGVGRMVEEFEDVAFSLKNKDDLSEPIKSQFGWHIIKLIEKKPVENFENMKRDILKSFEYDGRADICKNFFVDNLKKEYNFKLNSNAYQEILDYSQKNKSIDSTFLKNGNSLDKPLFTIKDNKTLQKEYIRYIYSNNNNTSNAYFLAKNLLNDFINEQVIRYEDTQLEQKYPDFKNLLQEYHDGILLFNISNDKVWGKAITDTVGIKKFFQENINKYAWKTPHYKGRIFYCKDKKLSKTIEKKLKKLSEKEVASYIESFNKDSLVVDFQQGIWSKGENPIIDKLVFKDSKANFNPTKKYPYVFVYGNTLTALPESYTDVRGSVVSDYQHYLEKKWINELENKFPIKVDLDVLKAVEKDTTNK